MKKSDQNISPEDMAAREAVIKRVLTNDCTKTEPICNLQAYFEARRYCRTMAILVLSFWKNTFKLYNNYIRSLKRGEIDLNLLLALKLTQQCEEFYGHEIEIVRGMIREFHHYVFSGNIFKTLILFQERDPDEYPYDSSFTHYIF